MSFDPVLSAPLTKVYLKVDLDFTGVNSSLSLLEIAPFDLRCHATFRKNADGIVSSADGQSALILVNDTHGTAQPIQCRRSSMGKYFSLDPVDPPVLRTSWARILDDD